MISTADHPGTSGSDSLAGADPILTRAVDEARAALVEQVGAEVVGDPQGFVSEGKHAVTQYFDCTQAGYPGWRWAVTVAHAEGVDGVTIDEIVLLPGEAAIIAPAWVPYRERIQPGDLSPGDILPTDEDDLRLVPAYLSGDPGDDASDDILAEAVDGRACSARSPTSSASAAPGCCRWRAASSPPTAGTRATRVPSRAISQQAPHACAACGFLVRLSGPLSLTFGVCANEYANDDGRVVALGHGCGAHSEAQLRKKQLPVPVPDPSFDTISRDDLEEF